MPYIQTNTRNFRNGKNASIPKVFTTNVRKARLRSVGADSRIVVIFPFGPKDIKIDNALARISQIQRPSRQPLLVVEGPSLVTLSFKAVIADPKTGGTNADFVDSVLSDLYTISKEGYECKFVYGMANYPYTFRITQFTVTEATRDYRGKVIKATVDIQLTESAPYNPELFFFDVVTFEPEVIPVSKQSAAPPPAPPDDSVVEHVAKFIGENAGIGSVPGVR